MSGADNGIDRGSVGSIEKDAPKIHAKRRSTMGMNAGLYFRTACGREVGRALGVRIGVQVTDDKNEVTCQKCKKAVPR